MQTAYYIICFDAIHALVKGRMSALNSDPIRLKSSQADSVLRIFIWVSHQEQGNRLQDTKE